MVADDDTAILEAIELMLEDEGYEVITLSDGKRVLGMYEQKPDLLLLDIWMSGVDGRDICKKLKSDIKFKTTPIIIISANNDTQRIAKEIGADDFIAKPFQMNELLSKVAKYVGTAE